MLLKHFNFIGLLALVISCSDAKVKTEKDTEPEVSTETKSYNGQGFEVYTTAKDTELRLSKTKSASFSDRDQPLETKIAVFVNPEKTFQTYLGIGGAITDASAEVFSTLDDVQQDRLLNSLYGKDGIGYNIIRTSIHSSDFGLGSHTYIEEGDAELKTFSIEKDREKRLPFIKRAIALIDNDLVFYASPWSPPAFMKTNNNMLQGGKLLPEFRQAWANYYVKFIEAYEAEGIPVWGLTIQNEPMAVQRWESCIYTAEEERDFLKNYLGPTLEKEGLGDKKIVVWDHNRDLISDRANTIFEDPEASKYAWGIGFHWYETWTGGLPKYDNLKSVNESFPSKNLLFTEGCQEGFDAEKLQFWPNAERYGNSMINDFNSGVVGWTDWNILLDERGGPNHVENFCFAPIHANTKTGELIYTPTYYYIGHFSKFIKPGALRVSTTTSRSTIESTSFKNKDGKMVTVVMNKTDEKIAYKLIVGNSEAQLEIEPRAMQSILY
ncbi:glycoside hydrolase family 30 beta sandwich domain-containing protein [Sediminibacter sp. Hel_I_10]|uniref:glycoside hydrolase family 30 protein n=1 Tax=Sediminibacter sp. Hel_I_10 TaxID=1392490 RepID=UPI00047A685D|nr:glycoside hydrolase family 30 protein [Sediminibacter sp. Hel_I_10]